MGGDQQTSLRQQSLSQIKKEGAHCSAFFFDAIPIYSAAKKAFTLSIQDFARGF